jgi:protein-S-isoprenylcysteine O-methyltransferase Ste14
LIGGVAGYLLLFTVLLFTPAGTLDWPRAWVLLAVLFVVRTAGTAAVARVHPALLAERARLPLHKEQPFSDKVLLLSFMATFAGLIAFIPFDRFRLQLLPRPGAAVSGAGLLLFAAGWAGVSLALRANAFAVTVVRHQPERRQTVVDAGPYRVVRHPLYAGLIFVLVGMGLWLESYPAALLAGVPAGLLIIRIRLEERFLRQALAGYESYRERVRWRLVPGLW